MQVQEIMQQEVVTLGAESSFADAAKILRDRRISSIMVKAETGLAGIITERDLVNVIAEGGDPKVVKLREGMTTDLITIDPKADADEAVHLMVDNGIRHLPVVSNGALVGVVSIRDAISGHPALRRLEEQRRQSMQARIADVITAFAGSMPFVYVHIVWFGAWIAINLGFLGASRFDRFPFGLLTMIVSLEAIFLSTFVMISQNRADERRQVLADHQWELVQVEEKQNEQLLEHSQLILNLTKAIHEITGARN
jgi:uncharacterized membrane protein/CBS domain-containing protein